MSKLSAPITTFRDYSGNVSARHRLRGVARSAALRLASGLKTDPGTGSYLRFPYYHHVFDDERAGFAAHLGYMRNLGEFVSLDEAVTILNEEKKRSGRFFCVTFDDGFRNCLTNAAPILSDFNCPAAFFVVTKYIDAQDARDTSIAPEFYGDGRNVEFMSWDECRELLAAGMTIGSHTVNHARLITLSDDDVEQELRTSKSIVEDKLGKTCAHFCCPWGRPDIDFRADRDPAIAARVGYGSFLTTRRGSREHYCSAMSIAREHLLANWGTYQLRYFFSQ